MAGHRVGVLEGGAYPPPPGPLHPWGQSPLPGHPHDPVVLPQEKLKLINPNKVPCVVNVKIRPRGESKDALTSAEAFDVRGYEVQQIPPHEHRYVLVGFRPQALTTYYATFEATVENGFDAKVCALPVALGRPRIPPDLALEDVLGPCLALLSQWGGCPPRPSLTRGGGRARSLYATPPPPPGFER